MDIASVIIGLVSLALFIVPVIYIQGKQKKAETRLQEDFLRVARQQQLVISQHDLWNSRFAIGIDTDKGVLFYLKKWEEGKEELQIHLSEVASCRVNNENREVNGNRVIDLIELRFTFRGSKLREQALEFYSKEESMSLSEELLLAEKWKSIVSTSIQNPQAHKNNTAFKGDPVALV